jgi:predicted transcriptional regulator
MEKLTKVEEEIMQLFWDEGPSTISHLISRMEDPKPPHSTISSIARILEKKGFLFHKAYGRTYEYYPAVDKKEYSRFSIKKLVKNYFDGSMNEMVSFLVKENDLNLKELSQLMEDVNDQD